MSVKGTGVPAGFKGGERDQFLINLDKLTAASRDTTAPAPVQYNSGGSAPADFKGGEAKQFTHPNEDNK